YNKQWHGMFRRLVAYQNEYGSTNVSRSNNDDPKLVRWIDSQRAFYNNKTISIDRIYRLESIGFVWDPLGEKWMEMYHKLVAYKKQHKSTNISSKYQEDPQLANWVHHQRTHYKTKSLSIDRINHLESIGFVWNALDVQWTGMYQKLMAYKKHYRSTKVPRHYTKDPQLGQWISDQRVLYKKNKLTDERAELLNSINSV
ncbi:hypothetical protein FRACYDRAFT_193338, partial [Fragilariopsis cylindrus CCMP1102]